MAKRDALLSSFTSATSTSLPSQRGQRVTSSSKLRAISPPHGQYRQPFLFVGSSPSASTSPAGLGMVFGLSFAADASTPAYRIV
ncbi:MAG TPA: hypothetical protein VLM85_25495 [Polyangiaceae bacterium]|nr:hypothetical protein [Polyangiaceae bacterium]